MMETSFAIYAFIYSTFNILFVRFSFLIKLAAFSAVGWAETLLLHFFTTRCRKNPIRAYRTLEFTLTR
jgi:hypothetical protein